MFNIFKKIFVMAVLATSVVTTELFGSVEVLQNVTTQDTIFPIYNDDKLIAILFGKEVSKAGVLINVKGPTVDLAKEDVDINLIKVGELEVYQLNSPIEDIVKFWRERILFSDGVMSSIFAQVEQETSQAFGKDKIHFRSPALDIDGVNFHINYKKSTCLIRHDVQIVARTGTNDVKFIIEKNQMPEKLELVTAESEELFIDLKKNVIELTKNVKVQQEQGTIYCDKMIIYLNDNSNKKEVDNDTINVAGSSAKISEIVCTGNVRMELNKDGESGSDNSLNFFSDSSEELEMVYCAGEKPVQDLTKTKQSVKIESTKIGADNMRWNFGTETIMLEGEVKLVDGEMELDCKSINVKLGKNEKNKTIIKEIICRGDVVLIEKENELHCQELTIYLKRVGNKNQLDKAIAKDQVLLVKNNPDKTKTTLNADSGTMLMSDNKAIFEGNVKVVDKDVVINSEILELFAKDIKDVNAPFPEAKDGEAPKRIRINDELELDRIIATKRVKIEKQNADGDNEKAYGNQAVYTVNEQLIRLLGTDKRPPVIVKGSNVLNARKGGQVIVDLNAESAYIEDGADLEIVDGIN